MFHLLTYLLSKQKLFEYSVKLVAWSSGNALCPINEVALHQAELVLEWVTGCLRADRYETSRLSQLNLPSFRGR